MARVLVTGFCGFPAPDRAGVQLRHVVRGLLRRHAVDVLVARRGDQAYVERYAGARLLRVPVPDGDWRARVEAFRRALRRQLEGADYDVVHIRDGWSATTVLELRGRLKYAVVFDAARAPLADPGLLEAEAAAELERAEQAAVSQADLVLAATESARRFLASLASADRVHLCPPGVDVDLFDWEEPAPGPPRIVFAGALSPGRGVRVLLRAMLDVAKSSDATLILAGPTNPEFARSLTVAVRELGLAGRVELPGEIAHEDLPALLASAAVCVAPGAPDLAANPAALYPTKLLEYLACQRAVVAPRRSSVQLLIRDEQHGLLFDAGQPIELAQQLLRLLGDPELRARLARAGYELVRRGHTASGTRRELAKAYAWLAARPAWRDRLSTTTDEQTAAPPPTGEGSDGPAWLHRRAPSLHQPIAAFEEEAGDDDGSGDTQLNEGFGEITKVESPFVEDERSASSYQQTTGAVAARTQGDDWVVDDGRIRQVEVGALASAERGPTTSPIDGSFVAGELEVRAPGAPPIPARDPFDRDDAFTAMAPPLGFGVSRPSGLREGGFGMVTGAIDAAMVAPPDAVTREVVAEPGELAATGIFERAPEGESLAVTSVRSADEPKRLVPMPKARPPSEPPRD